MPESNFLDLVVTTMGLIDMSQCHMIHIVQPYLLVPTPNDRLCLDILKQAKASKH